MFGFFRRPKPEPVRQSGLFLTHVTSPRIQNHFDRLVEQTRGLVDWHLVVNEGNLPNPRVDLPVAPAADVLPTRCRQMLENGGIQNGFADTLFIPCVLASPAPYVWVLEYDVDFSGDWSRLFRQFQNTPSDLLTTTVCLKGETPEWFHWRRTGAPPGVDSLHFYRAFMPIFRISQRLALAYGEATEDGGWEGHYEFTIPTVAHAAGFSVEDIVAGRPRSFRWARYQNYENHPGNDWLRPGTMVWRPSRPNYFFEAPNEFRKRNMLYHPIKTDNSDWNGSGE